MNIEDCIREIIDTFKSGDYFDSHVIINELIKNKNYHMVYLQGYSSNCNVAQFHGIISKTIGKNDLVISIGRSKSHTIYGEISENELWQKK
jgi:uncharacterized protein (DUF362 family)